MSNSALYVLTVLIWGSTWIGIGYQLGEVSPLVSIAHRFMLSTVIIFVFLWLRRPADMRLAWRDHGFAALQCLGHVIRGGHALRGGSAVGAANRV